MGKYFLQPARVRKTNEGNFPSPPPKKNPYFWRGTTSGNARCISRCARALHHCWWWLAVNPEAWRNRDSTHANNQESDLFSAIAERISASVDNLWRWTEFFVLHQLQLNPPGGNSNPQLYLSFVRDAAARFQPYFQPFSFFIEKDQENTEGDDWDECRWSSIYGSAQEHSARSKLANAGCLGQLVVAPNPSDKMRTRFYISARLVADEGRRSQELDYREQTIYLGGQSFT